MSESKRQYGRTSLLQAALLLLVAGCATSQDAGEKALALDLWPLLRTWHASESLSGGEALGPIIEWRDAPDAREFYLRPLYNRRNDRESDVVEAECLWPIGFGTERPDLSRSVVFPLSPNSSARQPETQPNQVTFPLFEPLPRQVQTMEQPVLSLTRLEPLAVY